MMQHLRLFVLAVSLTLICSVNALADKTTGDLSCANVTSKLIASNQVIFLRCATFWPTNWGTKVAQVELWEIVNNDLRNPVKLTGMSAAQPVSDNYIKVVVDPPLKGDRLYLLALKLVDTLTPGDIADPNLIVQISTKPTQANITASTAERETGRMFFVKSPIAIQSAGSQELIEKRQKGGKEITHDATVGLTPPTTDDPELVGRARVTLPRGRELRQMKATLKVAQLTDVLGQPITAENPVTIGSPVPKGKDDAVQYFQISHIAGEGIKPSYGINIKMKSLLFIPGSVSWGDFLIQPNIVVDIGTNTLAKKTDDTIQLGVTSNKVVCCSGDNKAFFQGIQFGPGALYETNRGFHKNNLLATFESNPILRGLVNPREERRRSLAARLNKNSIDDVDPDEAKFGYGLEFFFGLEAGGSPTEQIFKNKSKTASLDVRPYAIFRFRPRIHAFVEYSRFTLDLSETLRYLGTPEYVGEELPDQTIRLRRVAGWRSYMELTGSIGIDPSKHITFAVTYKRGAQPPSYPHVSTVQSGFILKY